MRNDFIENRKTNITDFGSKQLPLLYITGGSQGSVSINRIVAPIVPRLVQKYRVLHQCGSSDNEKDYKFLLSIKNSLPFMYKRNYRIEKHIDPGHIGSIYSSVFIVISRSGANTVTELAYKGIPSILIPLPWSGEREQFMNAKILENLGAAIIAEQKNLDGNILMEKIDSIALRYDTFKERASQAKILVPLQAADSIVSLIGNFTT